MNRVSILLLLVGAICAQAVELEGFLTDRLCNRQVWSSDGTKIPGGEAIDGVGKTRLSKDLETEPEKHTWHCLYEIQSCRDSGYTINQETAGKPLFNVSAGSGQYFPMYMLDNPGNTMAIELLAGSDRDDNMWVKVTGIVNGSVSNTTKYRNASHLPANQLQSFRLNRLLKARPTAMAAASWCFSVSS